MSLAQMLADLPTYCNRGSNRNAKGHSVSWNGYKLHIDTADGDIPISCILTSASLHDSQAALPLALMTSTCITHLYELMDSAYDVPEIHEENRKNGRIAIIDPNPRRNAAYAIEIENEKKAQESIGFKLPEVQRYNQRSSAERVNAALKDQHGARIIYVRGAAKVMCHLMFGVLTYTAFQLFRLVT